MRQVFAQFVPALDLQRLQKYTSNSRNNNRVEECYTCGNECLSFEIVILTLFPRIIYIMKYYIFFEYYRCYSYP